MSWSSDCMTQKKGDFMLLNLKLFASLFVIGLIVDFLWLGVIAKNFYLSQLGDLARLGPDGNLDLIKWAAGLVYVFIVLGIVLFVLPKIHMSDTYLLTLGWGFLFGIICYGVYDFTNYSTLAKYPLTLGVVDVLWGGALCAMLSALGKYLRDVIF